MLNTLSYFKQNLNLMSKYKINLIFFLPSFTKGGAAYSIYRLCKNLNKKYYKIHILCLGKCEIKMDLRKHVNTITELNVNRVFKTMFYLNSYVQKIYNQNNHKTIFISNLHYANIISLLSIKKNKNIKLILTERTSLQQLKIYYSFFDSLKKFVILTLIKLFYKKADLVIANSKREAKDISNLCDCKTKYIFPPSFKKLIKAEKKNINKKENWNILTVGSLVKEKGLDTIIKALSLIKNKNFKFDIFGKEYDEEQNEKRYLQELIISKNLRRKIKIHGFKKNLRNYYKKADLYINSSHIEGFSTAIIDAINYNLPIICSDCKGGNREISLNGRGGDLFKVGDYVELSKKINNFFLNPKFLIKKNKLAKKYIKNYSEKKNLIEYEKIFKTI